MHGLELDDPRLLATLGWLRAMAKLDHTEAWKRTHPELRAEAMQHAGVHLDEAALQRLAQDDEAGSDTLVSLIPNAVDRMRILLPDDLTPYTPDEVVTMCFDAAPDVFDRQLVVFTMPSPVLAAKAGDRIGLAVTVGHPPGSPEWRVVDADADWCFPAWLVEQRRADARRVIEVQDSRQ